MICDVWPTDPAEKPCASAHLPLAAHVGRPDAAGLAARGGDAITNQPSCGPAPAWRSAPSASGASANAHAGCAAWSVRACEQRTPRCPIAVLAADLGYCTDLYVVPTEPASRGPPVRFVYVAINAARPPRPPLRGRPGSLRDAMEIFDLGHLKPPRQARCQPLLHQPPKRSRRRFQAPVQSRSTSSYICAITG